MVALKVGCHCKKIFFNIDIPEEQFPLKSAICHCKSCRHATGQIFTTFAVIPTDVPSELRDGGNNTLTTYRSSSTLLRLFCQICGASIANFDSATEEEWELATGCIEFLGDPLGHEGKLNRVQLWLDDVKGDGGAAGWINGGKEEGMDRYWRGRDSEMVSDADIANILTGETHGQESELLSQNQTTGRDYTLNVRCHCGTISFDVIRPQDQPNRDTEAFEAGLDACTSCRLVTGFEITSWATVPHGSIITTEPTLNAYLGDRSRLKHYKSSSDVSRYFCTRCGATIFYQKHGLATIDIAIGVLNPPVSEQARAEDWLRWLKYPKGIFYSEDAVDRKFLRGLMDGLRLHKGERGGQ